MMDDSKMMDVLARQHKENRKREVSAMLRKMLPKASRQELTPILKKEGWDNYDIIEILEGIDSEDML